MRKLYTAGTILEYWYMTLKINAEGPTDMWFNPARWKSIREMSSSRVAMNVETNAND